MSARVEALGVPRIPRIARNAVANAALLSLAALTAYALKRHYSTANADDLQWLLGPATALVQWITGESFVREARVGFVGEELPIVIAPACAGVNFLVIALLTLSFGFVPRLRSCTAKVGWFVLCPLVAYAATLVANTARIGAAVAIHRVGFRPHFMTGAEVHRALGVVVYLSALWMLFAIVDRSLERVGT